MSKPLKHSYSKLDQFQKCQRQYALDRLFPPPEENDSPALVNGTAVHAALEDIGKRALVGNLFFGEVAIPAKTSEKVTKQITGALGVLKNSKPIAIEQWFSGVDKLPICGKIDLIGVGLPIFGADGKVESWDAERQFILDYKTTGNPMTVPDVPATERSLQLAIYSLALKRKIKDVGYLFMLPTGRFIARFVTLMDAALDRALKWVTEQITAIEARAGGLETGDVSGFALAAYNYEYCSSRHCPQWSRCLGATDKDGKAETK